MKDPLAGKRQAINTGNGSTLFWPDKGGDCPVEVGQILPVKIGGIEIVRKERLRRDGEWQWRADYVRIRKSEEGRRFLKVGDGYTNDPKLAMRSQDDSYNAATLDALPWDAREDAHRNAGEPPEGEAVPDWMIPHLKPSREAQQRHELEIAQERITEAQAPVEVRLARLRERAKAQHVDISSEERIIKKRVEAIERKISGTTVLSSCE